MIKQVIVIRKDLNMRKGKIAAQAAHASMKVFFDRGEIKEYGYTEWNNFEFRITPEMQEWIEGSFTKICVSVDSEAQVLEVYNKALSSGIPCSLITDSGLTEFHGIPTVTCCAIGPDDSEKIDKITGGLKLL